MTPVTPAEIRALGTGDFEDEAAAVYDAVRVPGGLFWRELPMGTAELLAAFLREALARRAERALVWEGVTISPDLARLIRDGAGWGGDNARRACEDLRDLLDAGDNVQG